MRIARIINFIVGLILLQGSLRILGKGSVVDGKVRWVRYQRTVLLILLQLAVEQMDIAVVLLVRFAFAQSFGGHVDGSVLRHAQNDQVLH